MTSDAGWAAAAQGATVGVDVGGTKMLAVLVDGDGAVLAERVGPVPLAATGDVLLDAVAAQVDELRRVARDRGAALDGVGLGLPGLVTATGRLQASAHLTGAEGVDAAAGLRHRTRLPVAVDNDATCATLAEWQLGAARGCDDVVLVAVGTGIGAGVVAAGRLVRGRRGFAGEAGHMVVDPAGPDCPCGRRGCWERYASGDGLGRLGRLAASRGEAAAVVALAGGDPDAVRGEHVTAAAAAGDAEARALVGELARWLALGIANILALLDCRRVVIAGGLAAIGADLLAPLDAALHAPGILGRGRPPVELATAELGPRAGAVGAAILAGRPRHPGASR